MQIIFLRLFEGPLTKNPNDKQETRTRAQRQFSSCKHVKRSGTHLNEFDDTFYALGKYTHWGWNEINFTIFFSFFDLEVLIFVVFENQIPSQKTNHEKVTKMREPP